MRDSKKKADSKNKDDQKNKDDPKKRNDPKDEGDSKEARKVPDAAGAVPVRASAVDAASEEEGIKSTGPKGKAKTSAKGVKIPSLDEQIQAKKHENKCQNTKYTCFTGDTSVYTPNGYRPIKEIRKHDDIYSRNAETGETGLQKVKELFQSQAYTIYHIWLEDQEEIKTTAYHPFYIKDKGWVNAIHLKEGDLAETMDGTARITKIVKERQEEPVAVYNFHVYGWESYFVSKLRVYVHNKKCDLGDLEACKKNIDEYLAGNKTFEEALDDYAKLYADAVYSDKPWTWNDTIYGGRKIKKKDRKKIRERALENEMLPKVTVTKTQGTRYGIADFESAGLVEYTLKLPKKLWHAKDAEQFKYLNGKLKEKGISTEGFTWHHSEVPGGMQLVPLGIHNSVNHDGGRKLGWAKGRRK